jgi:dihydrofolate reductase
MKISLIVAMSTNRVIGVNNGLPWHLSADLRRFKSLTLGKPILMGRKTHESIGRALPGRKNIVISSRVDYRANGCEVVHDIEEAIAVADDAEELMVIGGSSLYEALLLRADRIYLTQIDAEFEGDTFFPAIDSSHWKETASEIIDGDTSVAFTYRFIVLDRLVVTKPAQT